MRIRAAAAGILLVWTSWSEAGDGPAKTEASHPPVSIRFTERGLERFDAAGASLLGDGRVRVRGVRLTKTFRDKNKEPYEKQLDIDPAHDPYAGDSRIFRDGDTVASRTNVLVNAGQLTETYDWGRLQVVYKPLSNGLEMAVSLANASTDVIEQVTLDLLTLHLPGTNVEVGVLSSQPKWARADANIGAPLVVRATSQVGDLELSSPKPNGPLRYHLEHAGDGEHVLRVTVGDHGGGGEVYDGVWCVRPIPPGGQDSFVLDLRLGQENANPWQLATAAAIAFREKHPFLLRWPDRRPIGAIHVADGRTSEANPRGWKHAAGTPADWDIHADDAFDTFRHALLRGATNILHVARIAGMQGVIVWQIEGQQFDKCAYYGEPRLVKWIAPEMDAAADDFFSILREGGLRTGVCIRPPIYAPRDKEGNRVAWKDVEVIQGINWTRPSRQDAYSDRFDTLFDKREAQSPLERLDAKIRYAQKRWGCTLFYIDTNHFWRPRDRGREDWAWSSRLLSAGVFEELYRRHPDVLLIPEHEYVEYWSATAPYLQPPSWGHFTRRDVRAVYPDAFSVISSSPGQPYIQQERSTYLQAVIEGDTFLVNGWYGGQDTAAFYLAAAQLAPYRVRLASAGGWELDRREGGPGNPPPAAPAPAPAAYKLVGKADQPSGLTPLLTDALASASTTSERRVWIVYDPDTPPEQRQAAVNAVAAGGGIIAWASER